MADQLGDVKAGSDLPQQVLRREIARLQREIGRGRRNRRAAAHAAPVGFKAKFPRRRSGKEPVLQDTILDHRHLLAPDALAIEGTRGRAAHDLRVVGEIKALFQNLLTHPVAQEAGLAGNRSAVDRAGNRTDEAAGDAWIENHSDVAAGIDLARADTPHDFFTGAATNFFGRIQIGIIKAAVEIVVALHLRAFAGDDADGATETAAHIAAGKTV
ncbi:hypothetical protein D3C86_1396220 [compost metagenome]